MKILNTLVSGSLIAGVIAFANVSAAPISNVKQQPQFNSGHQAQVAAVAARKVCYKSGKCYWVKGTAYRTGYASKHFNKAKMYRTKATIKAPARAR